jgi:hypothetical protein
MTRSCCFRRVPRLLFAIVLLGGTAQAEPQQDEAQSWTDRIEIKGDFRYRVELIDEAGENFRHRHRIRARFGVHAEILDDLGAVIQLGTGNDDTPVSNNQTLTDAFSSKPLWLDLAYFDWHPSYAEGLRLVGGKVKNPFYRVAKTELQWDPDLNPEGLALGFRRDFGPVEPFVQGGAFWMEERKEDPDSWLLGVQGGLKSSFADGLVYVLAGASYMHFTAMKGYELFWSSTNSFGNSTVVIGPDGGGDDILGYANEFHEVNAFTEIGGKIDRLPWAVFADWVTNTAADEDDVGWLVGGSLGKCRERFDIALRYIYRDIEKDAVVGILNDSDFNDGSTDANGHEVNFAVQLARRVQFAASYFYNHSPLEAPEPYHRAQFDLNMKF